jgi:hypothetical protein
MIKEGTEMKRKTLLSVLGLALLLGALIVVPSGAVTAQGPGPQGNAGIEAALGTAFTYQGRLDDGGSAANGTYDFEFKLYDAASGGSEVGSTVTKGDVAVTDGLFTVELDFGSGAFTGDARWLEIGVRAGSSTGAYTTLTPRQPLRPAPYALALPGLRTEPNATSPNVIGGYSGNSVASSVVGATIGGGGSSGNINQVTADYATVGGGRGNSAGNTDDTVAGGHGNEASGDNSTVGGGVWNRAIALESTVGGGETNTASGSHSTVGGGSDNTASGGAATIAGGDNNVATGNFATVGGGLDNTATLTYTTVSGGDANEASGFGATVGGGYDNIASGWAATIGGGRNNESSNNYPTVGGGVGNTANGNWATVGGGVNNTASGSWATVGGGSINEATGSYATVPGGYDNTAAGDHSFAAGSYAKANHDGSFVWADSTSADFASTAEDQFLVRANGGAVFTGTNSSTAILEVNNLGTTPGILSYGGSHGIAGYGNIGAYGSGSTYGVFGTSTNTGVYGTGSSYGVYGVSPVGGIGIYARSSSGNPIEAYSSPSDREFYVSNGGNVYADGTFNSGGADFSEMLPAVEGLEPGDVLIVGSDGKLIRSTQAYQPTVVGVYSTQPGFLGGANEDVDLTGKIPLAVIGVVPVKVSAENGPIRPGDLLTASSIPGHAMKAGPSPVVGTVIGKALEGLDEDTGVILMLVMLQ